MANSTPTSSVDTNSSIDGQEPQGFNLQFFKSHKFAIGLAACLAIVILLTGALYVWKKGYLSRDNKTDQIERKTVDAYGRAPVAGEDYEPGQIIFGLKTTLTSGGKELDPEGVSISQIDAYSSLLELFKKYKVEKISRLFTEGEVFKNVYIASFPKEENALNFMTELQMNPDVEFDEPNYYAKLEDYIPSDPYFLSKGSWGQAYDDLWNLKIIDMPRAWEITRGDPSIRVGIVDTGIDHLNPDLSGNVLPGVGGLFSPIQGLPGDCNETHGTHLAGIIAAKDDGSGVVGVAPNVKVQPFAFFFCGKIPPDKLYKFLPREGTQSGGSLVEKVLSTSIARLIFGAANSGVQVINLSIGMGYDSFVIDKTVDFAISKGITVSVAAGNESRNTLLSSPSNNPKAIIVSATTPDDRVAKYSNYGPNIIVAAPGGDLNMNILSTGSTQTDLSTLITRSGVVLKVDDTHVRLSGTSMAAPHVAGLAALVKSLHPDWSNKKIKCTIILGAEDKGNPGWDEKYGYGRINAYKTLSLDQNIVTEDCTPIAKIVSPVTNSGHDMAESVSITGMAYAKDINYALLQYSNDGIKWVDIQRFTENIPAETLLSNWELQNLTVGNYQLRLTVVSKSGARAVDEVSVYLFKNIFKKNLPIEGSYPTPGVGSGYTCDIRTGEGCDRNYSSDKRSDEGKTIEPLKQATCDKSKGLYFGTNQTCYKYAQLGEKCSQPGFGDPICDPTGSKLVCGAGSHFGAVCIDKDEYVNYYKSFKP